MDGTPVNNLLKTIKIPLSSRIRSAAHSFFYGIFSGIMSVFMAPFYALEIFFVSEKQEVDMEALRIFAAEVQGIPMGEDAPQDGPDDGLPDDLANLLDQREPWKKAHDEEYGDDYQ